MKASIGEKLLDFIITSLKLFMINSYFLYYKQQEYLGSFSQYLFRSHVTMYDNKSLSSLWSASLCSQKAQTFFVCFMVRTLL